VPYFISRCAFVLELACGSFSAFGGSSNKVSSLLMTATIALPIAFWIASRIVILDAEEQAANLTSHRAFGGR
jgi:hypothetical protein